MFRFSGIIVANKRVPGSWQTIFFTGIILIIWKTEYGLMDIPDKHQKELRTWVFFFLIVLVALLWATFLLTRGEMLFTSVSLAIIATFMSSFAFTFTTRFKRYIYLNLIIFAAILWATFLLMQSAMLAVSLFMYAVAGCINIFAFLWIEQNPEDEQIPALLPVKKPK
jgi:MFS family permease